MNRLKELRLARNLTTTQLGRLIDLDASMITHIEKEKKTFSIESLNRACDYFGVSPDYLLGRSPEDMFNNFVDSFRGDFLYEMMHPDGDVTQSLSDSISEPIRTKLEILFALREVNDRKSLDLIRDLVKLKRAQEDFSKPIGEGKK